MKTNERKKEHQINLLAIEFIRGYFRKSSTHTCNERRTSGVVTARFKGVVHLLFRPTHWRLRVCLDCSSTLRRCRPCLDNCARFHLSASVRNVNVERNQSRGAYRYIPDMNGLIEGARRQQSTIGTERHGIDWLRVFHKRVLADAAFDIP